MPDKVVDVPGVGSVSFPDSMTDDQISAAIRGTNATQALAAPRGRTWADTLTDWMPTAGGAVGGLVGGIGGTVAGLGVGGVPGAVGGAALGGAAGEAAKQLVNRARGSASPDTMGQAATDIATQAGIQGASDLAGAGIGKVMSGAGSMVMRSALKPSSMAVIRDLAKGVPVPRAVQTLLDEGVNVTAQGYQKLQSIIGTTTTARDAMITDAMASGQTGVNPFSVASRLTPAAQKAANNVTPKADLAAITRAGNEFLETYGDSLIPLDKANAIKSGTQQTLSKEYGKKSEAFIAARKALASGLREEIEQQVPGVDVLNQRIGDASEAAKAVMKRIAVTGNRDVGGISLLANDPSLLLASIVDRHPAAKSLIARGLYSSAGAATKVSPQVIRALVQAVSSDAGAGNSDSSSGR